LVFQAAKLFLDGLKDDDEILEGMTDGLGASLLKNRYDVFDVVRSANLKNDLIGGDGRIFSLDQDFQKSGLFFDDFLEIYDLVSHAKEHVLELIIGGDRLVDFLDLIPDKFRKIGRAGNGPGLDVSADVFSFG